MDIYSTAAAMVYLLLPIAVLAVVVALTLALALIFSACFCVRRSAEHYRVCAKLPSMPRGRLADLKLSLRHATLKPRDVLPYFGQVLKEYGSVVHMNVLGHSYVLLNDPEDIKALLSSNQHINKGPEYGMLKPWLNKGLLTSGSKLKKEKQIS